MEDRQAELEAVISRLTVACQSIESIAGAGSAGQTALHSPRTPSSSGARRQSVLPNRPGKGEREERYDRVRELLSQGHKPSAIARQLGLGMAEVELMDRIIRHNPR